ncbi:carbohydrate ABC transporter permease [Deinococcus cellulosilyticus]|uniref:Sugar ABC transporter permease n=1 Tax=Deinococcus cellulosilyticus (strain DSM 18568 / NBRC 106333 / KACC 11606 / 5516J-15) TaxID=1223518 RepID=A0A511N054_DEIC1|nr:carbohydrate ABC transporter permease [Deinococcus cellulosilyticus]GEM46255.1 sugar ABC transporter permease [Deinococcus cellulosilyticus NBRC 106333 = KACC 11606]
MIVEKKVAPPQNPLMSAAVLRSLPTYVVLLITSVIWMLPTLALLISSFRPQDKIANTGWWSFNFAELNLANYEAVLAGNNLGMAFVNSLYLTVPTTVLTIALASLAAYAFSWMPFKGSNLLFTVLVALSVVPIQMSLGPTLKLMTLTHLTGTFPAVWLAHTAYGLPFSIFLMRNFFSALPKEMFESAYLDGASPLVAFMRLALPTAVPALASLAIFQFMWVWNDLLVALIFLGGSPSVAVLPVAISNLVGQYGDGWQLLTAAAFISMSLPLLLFFSMQRYFVQGILAGSVKG